MSATAKTIDGLAPTGARLVVTRNAARRTVTLSIAHRIERRNTVVASIALDNVAIFLLREQCADFPLASTGGGS